MHFMFESSIFPFNFVMFSSMKRTMGPIRLYRVNWAGLEFRGGGEEGDGTVVHEVVSILLALPTLGFRAVGGPLLVA